MRFYTVTTINLLIASIALGAPLDSVHEECYQSGKCMSVEARTASYPTPVPTTFAVTTRGDAVATEAQPTPSTVIGTPENEDEVDDDIELSTRDVDENEDEDDEEDDNENDLSARGVDGSDKEENENEDDENSIQARSANKHKPTSHSKPKPKTPSKPKPKDPNNKNPKKKESKKEDPKKTNKPKAHCTNKKHPGNAKQTPKPAGGKRDFDEEAAPINTVSVNDN